ncbi:DUF6049 family protein [Leucobacter luti]|nr:DUF6049 family protein [Leucobacter luti]
MAFPSRIRALPAAVLAVGLVAGSLAATSAPVTAARAADSSEESASDPASLVVSPRDPVIRADTAELRFDVLLRNPGTEELPAGRLQLRFGSAQLADAEQLDTILPVTSPLIAEASIGAVAAGEDRTATLTVPRDDIPLGTNAAFGVHSVQASYTPGPDPDTTQDEEQDPAEGAAGAANTAKTSTADAASGAAQKADTASAVDPSDADSSEVDPSDADPSDAADTSDPGSGVLTGLTQLVTELGTPGAPPSSGVNAPTPTVSLGLIVPLVLPSDIRTLPTRRQLEELAPKWDALLTEARIRQATLAIDPRIVAGIRAYGEEAPENARALLERMSALSLPTFMLQFADADPAAQAALGYSKLLAPSSLDFVSRFGVFPAADSDSVSGTEPREQTPQDAANEDQPDLDSAATEAVPTDPAPTEDGNDPGPEPTALPTLAELLAWPTTIAAAWPAEGAVDQATLSLLESSGIRTVVLDSSNVSGNDTPRASVGATSALITDAALGDAARTAIGGATSADRNAGTARLGAMLALAAQSNSSGVLIGLDRGALGDAEDPSALLTRIGTFNWVSSSTVAALPEGKASLRAGDTLEERRELLRTAAGRETSVNELGAVLVHAEYLSGYQRTRLLELFATRFAEPEDEFAAVAAHYRERDAELLEGVRALSTEHTQLVGTSTRVPVQLHNSLPFDALVSVRVDPSSAALSLPERDFPDITVPAEANQRILVPVHSRVSSGESGLVVSVSAATGEPTVFTGTLSISIRSVVETIGLWTLGSLAALLLGFGIWRSLRRKRSSEAGQTAAHQE